MHGVEENSMTGARGTQVVNGSIAPPAGAQVGPPIVATKIINKGGVISPPTSSGASSSVTFCQQQGAIINIMSRPGTVATATPNGTPVSVPLQPGMQIVNMRPNQGIQMASGRSLSPRMIVNQIPNVRPGQAGQQLTLQSLPSLPPGTQGHLIVKTENGQLQLLRVNTAPPNATQIPPNGTPTTANTMVVHQANNTYRFQQPQTTGTTIVSMPNNTTVNPQVVTAGGQTVVVPASAVTVPATSSAAVIGSVTTTATSAVTTISTQPAQASPAVGTQTISAESAKTKCKNFLATLLRLASEQRAKVAQNVRSLIQGLIDGKVEPEAFTEELQKDLNSSPQPCLVPFLRKTLPYLRTSLARGELSIEGVRPPPISAVAPVTGMTTVIPSMVGLVRSTTPTSSGGLRVVTPNSGASAIVHRPVTSTNIGIPTPTQTTARVVAVQQMRVANSKAAITTVKPPTIPSSNCGSPSPQVSSAVAGNNSTSAALSSSLGASSNSGTIGSSASSTVATSSSKSSGSKSSTKEDKKSSKEKNLSYNSSYTPGIGDDDINDVAAMGGVNLGEESQRILDSTGFVGTQIRSCKDEMFLAATPLTQRIKQIVSDNNMEEPPKDVISLISHAVQERLKTLVEKLGIIAEHRLDLIRAEPRYEIVQDVKGQLKFLEELDKLEKRRKDEQEREILLRAAKSRSKSEDPEQAKLKAKAKEMQRVEMEEMRQREANLTALKALQGPRKKPKLDMGGEEGSTFSGTFTQKQMPVRPRIKRVNLRDLQFLMEQEKDLTMSHTLYKTYLK